MLGGCSSTSTARASISRKTINYKGMMFSDVPNLASAFGYTNASWTLKCDLTCEYVCRLLNHMDEHGYAAVHAAPQRSRDHGEPCIDFSLGLRPARARQVPEAGLEGAVAALPELRARHPDAALRLARRRAMEFSNPAQPNVQELPRVAGL